MNIIIGREGQNVSLYVSIVIPYCETKDFQFQLACGCEEYAGLLSAAMIEQIQSQLEQIRKTAYEKGYKDGRGKKAMRSWFPGWWE
jgi:hypothetical protein